MHRQEVLGIWQQLQRTPLSVIFWTLRRDSTAVYGNRNALPGCPASRGETVEEACMVHGIDTDELLEELNKQIAAGDAQ